MASRLHHSKNMPEPSQSQPETICQRCKLCNRSRLNNCDGDLTLCKSQSPSPSLLRATSCILKIVLPKNRRPSKVCRFDYQKETSKAPVALKIFWDADSSSCGLLMFKVNLSTRQKHAMCTYTELCALSNQIWLYQVNKPLHTQILQCGSFTKCWWILRLRES